MQDQGEGGAKPQAAFQPPSSQAPSSSQAASSPPAPLGQESHPLLRGGGAVQVDGVAVVMPPAPSKPTSPLPSPRDGAMPMELDGPGSGYEQSTSPLSCDDGAEPSRPPSSEGLQPPGSGGSSGGFQPAPGAPDAGPFGPSGKLRYISLNRRGLWEATFSHQSKTKYVGSYATAEEAARAADWYIIEHGLRKEPNWPRGDYVGTNAVARPEPVQGRIAKAWARQGRGGAGAAAGGGSSRPTAGSSAAAQPASGSAGLGLVAAGQAAAAGAAEAGPSSSVPAAAAAPPAAAALLLPAAAGAAAGTGAGAPDGKGKVKRKRQLTTELQGMAPGAAAAQGYAAAPPPSDPDWWRPQPMPDPSNDKLVHERPAKPMAQALSCHLCSDLLREAMTSTECGHRFCYDCIEQRIRIGKRNACPLCEQPWGFDPYFTGKLAYDAVLDGLVHAIFPRPQLDAYLQAGRTERELATRQARAALNKPGMRPVPRQGGGGGAGPSAAASALGPLQQLEARGGFAAGQGKLQVHLGPPGDDGDGEEAGEAVFGAPGGMGAPAAGGAGPSRRPYKRRPRPKAEAGDGADPNAPLGPPKLLLALFPWQEAVTPTAGAAATATGEMDGGPLGADSVGAVAGSPSPGGGSGRAAAVPSAAARRTPHALPALAALDKPYMLVEAGQKLEALAAWVNAKLLRKNKALPELLCAGEVVSTQMTLGHAYEHVWLRSKPAHEQLITFYYRRGSGSA